MLKWFLRILSGTTPFDLTKTIIVQDISHKRLDLAQQRKRIWALNKKDVLNRYNKNNGGIIRHKCFRKERKSMECNLKQNRLANFKNADFTITEKATDVRLYQNCLWCNKCWKNPKLKSIKMEFKLKRGLIAHLGTEMGTISNTIKFLDFSMHKTLVGEFSM